MNKELFIAVLTTMALFGAGCGDAPMADLQDPPVDPDPVNPIDPVDPDPVDPDPVDPDPVNPLPVENKVAPFDNDSLNDPAVEIFMSITGNREIEYAEQISEEEGDTQDWVGFELPNNSNSAQRIRVAVECSVLGDQDAFARAEILNVDRDGTTERASGSPVDCGEGLQNVTVDNTKEQVVRIFVAGSPEEQTLIDYELFVEGFR